MQRKFWGLFLGVMLTLQLVGCGTKDASSVVEDLSERAKSVESYSSHGKMTIHTGEQPKEYEVEVWYMKPDFYRVSLKNIKKDVEQILLKNKQGVFVLTPHLQKSYRFQNDWPKSSGQIYLYQTLLDSIINDQTRLFQAGDDTYQFEVASKYSLNPDLQKQRILLDDDLNPKRVDVLNEDNEVMVRMEFDRFKTGVSFDNDAFDMDRNMQGPGPGKETLGPIYPNPLADKLKFEKITADPASLPAGSYLAQIDSVATSAGPVVIMRYSGPKSFTITERKARVESVVTLMNGKMIDLDGTIGVFWPSKKFNQLVWTNDGLDFAIVGNLSTEEMKKMADSMLHNTGTQDPLKK